MHPVIWLILTILDIYVWILIAAVILAALGGMLGAVAGWSLRRPVTAPSPAVERVAEHERLAA